MAPTLSRRLPYAVHMHDAPTMRFVGFKTRRVRFGPEPPPPSENRWSVRLVPRAQEPDQRLRVRASVQRRCFSDLLTRSQHVSAWASNAVSHNARRPGGRRPSKSELGP